MRYGVIKRCADDRNIRLYALDLARILNPRELCEGDWANVRRAIVSISPLLGVTPPKGGNRFGKGGFDCAHVHTPMLTCAAGSI
jgi:hypothetical protein